MKSYRPEAEPKPFALVEIPDEAPSKARATTHERFAELTGCLDLVITVESEYLFVGSGSYEFDPKARDDRPDVWHTFYRRTGRICIPGTSIKGAIRAIVEAISNSCVSQSREHEVRLIGLGEAHRKRCSSLEKVCPACRLFGFTGLRGRISFVDALLQEEVSPEIVKIPELWHHNPKKIRRLDKARRFYENKRFLASPNQKPEPKHWFVEAIPRGAKFQTILSFENVTRAELGLVFHAFGWQPSESGFDFAFTPKLGGAKPRCFGAVKIAPVQLRLRENNMLVSGVKARILEGAELSCFLAESLQACRRSTDNLFYRPSWQALLRGFQRQTGNCPRGIY